MASLRCEIITVTCEDTELCGHLPTIQNPLTTSANMCAHDLVLARHTRAAAQALEEERLGPRREPYSGERQKRLAVQEAATALMCTLMPAIEPLTLVRHAPPTIAGPLHSSPQNAHASVAVSCP